MSVFKGRRFLLIPDFIRSKNDGQSHFIDGPRLAQFYRLPNDIYWFHNDRRLHEQGTINLKECTRLSPQAGGNYELPSPNFAITDNVAAMYRAWKSTVVKKPAVGPGKYALWTYPDVAAAAILADALEEAGYNDENYPWLLTALRDPEESPTIYSEIFRNVDLAILSYRLKRNKQELESCQPPVESTGEVSTSFHKRLGLKPAQISQAASLLSKPT